MARASAKKQAECLCRIPSTCLHRNVQEFMLSVFLGSGFKGRRDRIGA
jgi:hypothetical protein